MLLLLPRSVYGLNSFEQPGGATILRKYALPQRIDVLGSEEHGSETYALWNQATWAFMGGLNIHSRAAKNRLEEFTIATLTLED